MISPLKRSAKSTASYLTWSVWDVQKVDAERQTCDFPVPVAPMTTTRGCRDCVDILRALKKQARSMRGVWSGGLLFEW